MITRILLRTPKPLFMTDRGSICVNTDRRRRCESIGKPRSLGPSDLLVITMSDVPNVINDPGTPSVHDRAAGGYYSSGPRFPHRGTGNAGSHSAVLFEGGEPTPFWVLG